MKGIQRLDTKYYKSANMLYKDDGFVKPGAKTRQFNVYSYNHRLIGHVKWWTKYKSYCFFPLDSQYSKEEMLQFAEFCELVNREHRAKQPHINRLKEKVKARRQRRMEELKEGLEELPTLVRKYV